MHKFHTYLKGVAKFMGAALFPRCGLLVLGTLLFLPDISNAMHSAVQGTSFDPGAVSMAARLKWLAGMLVLSVCAYELSTRAVGLLHRIARRG